MRYKFDIKIDDEKELEVLTDKAILVASDKLERDCDEIVVLDSSQFDLKNADDESVALLTNQAISKSLKVLKKELKSANKTIKELQNDIKDIKNESNKLTEDNKEMKERLIKTDSKVIELEDKLDVIGENGLSEDLRKAIDKRIFSFTGNAGTPKYILYFKKYKINLQNYIKKELGVNKYSKIPTRNFGKAMEMARKWTPSSYLKNRINNEYAQMYEDGAMKENEKKAYEILLEKTGGKLNAV